MLIQLLSLSHAALFIIFIALSLTNNTSLAASSEIEPDNKSTTEMHISTLVMKAEEKHLSSKKKWQSLLHYYSPAIYDGELRSYVDDQKFFISPQGKSNPAEELKATITSLFDDKDKGNNHVICRFPARLQWLKKQLDLTSKSFPNPKCKDYEAWEQQVNASHLSLIFPSAYINSPSSMFGHTLFRFDPSNIDDSTDWLSWSLSYGAQMNASDNSITFAYRGIFGGYPGIFNINRYFQKIKEYNSVENRDIWEYELDISSIAIEEMLKHAWELKEIEFDYYFLDENCSFRLLEFIELVKPEVKLTDQFKITAIPADTVRAIIDEGLVKSASYKPSAITKLKSRIKELSTEEAKLARKLSDNISILKAPEYNNLTPEKRAKLVQVAYSYLRYKQLKIQRDSKIAQRSHQLLIELNSLPNEKHKVPLPARPETGHKTSMIGSSVGIEEDKLYTQLDYRLTYHDLLDNPLGYPKGAHISMGNTQFRYSETNQLKIHRFDFIDIISLSEMDPFFNSPSWHVKTGYEHIFAQSNHTKIKQTGAYYVKAGGGASTAIIQDSIMLYGFADVRIENNSIYKSFVNAAFGLSGGVLSYSSFGTFNATLETDYFTNNQYRVRTSLQQNISLGINDDIRIGTSFEWQRANRQYETVLSYRHFF